MNTEKAVDLDPRYIICAMIESKLIDLPTLIGWIDEKIILLDKPKHWLYSVSLGSNLDEINYSILLCLADENLMYQSSIDALVIGFTHMRYKDGSISYMEVGSILSGYFVSDQLYFNEDSLNTFFDHPEDDVELTRNINQKFIEYEKVARQANAYFYSDSILENLQ